MTNHPEVWMRGPVPGIPPLLQPVAHALLQAREELGELMTGFPDDKLFIKLAGMASAGFHLQHMAGVLDRLFTYARGEKLSTAQLDYLSSEGKADTKLYTSSVLVENFNRKVEQCLYELSLADEATLTDYRGVGRAGLPSTVIGLYVHAAEHTMRHLGQLLVTVKVVLDRE